MEKPMDTSAREQFPAKIIDISQGGARLELKEMLQPKEKVRVRVADEKVGFGLDVTGVVRWSEKVTGGYEAGLEFTQVKKFALGQGEKRAEAKPS